MGTDEGIHDRIDFAELFNRENTHMAELTDAKVRAAKPVEITNADGTISYRPAKLTDTKGLRLLVRENGTRVWQLRYRFGGREQIFTIGNYPEISLKQAREERDEARKLVSKGIHPTRHRDQQVAVTQEEQGNTFDAVAERWLAYRLEHASYKKKSTKALKGSSINYARNAVGDLSKKAGIGKRPVASIDRREAMRIVRSLEQALPISRAKRARDYADDIFEYCFHNGLVDINPFEHTSVNKPKPEHHKHFDEAGLADAIRKIHTHPSEKLRILALLTVHLFPRKCELLEASWEEFDFPEAVWRIPAERMKMERPHTVPLSRQVFALLARLHAWTGARSHLWPNTKDPRRPMASGTINRVLRDVGINDVTPHGFRGTASTLLHGAIENGRLLFEPHVIEAQFSHGPSNRVAASYNHQRYLEARRDLMQWWSDYLDRISKEPEYQDSSTGVSSPAPSGAPSNVVAFPLTAV